MRMNRGTIILIVALVVVFVGAALISNQQSSTDTTPTPTVNAEAGPLFTDVTAPVVAHYELRQASDGSFIDLRRLDAQNWSVNSPVEDPTRTPDSSLIESTASQLVGIQYTTSFDSADLASFGLDHPQMVLFLETGTGDGYTLYIGDKAPTNPRYYVVLEPGVASPSPAAESTAEATGEATGEATAEAMSAATAEATAEAMTTADMTPEATAEASLLTGSPFAAVVPPSPRAANFVLSGSKKIYVIPQTVLTTMIGWLTTPPYQPVPTATPTELPTLESAVIPEVTLEMTPEMTPEMTGEAMPEATEAPAPSGEMTPEATAAS